MKCLACRHENREGRRFCVDCGVALPASCLACGEINDSGDKFCGGCGKSLFSSNPPPPAFSPSSSSGLESAQPSKSPEGERRQATVLFSDLSGYTAMNERLDPEEVQAIMTRIKDESVRIVESHGGMVNQFVGDEVVALFGIPTAHEDDPRRAVVAALEFHQFLRDISTGTEPQPKEGLYLHTGISTGLVVTQLHDDRDGRYGITGDTVNTGARLAAHAEPDTILVTPETYALVRPYFELEVQHPVDLKGKKEPVTPFLVLRETRVHSRLEISAERGFKALIGREGELATLQNCMSKAMSGRGQFISLVGDAGVGKSRLMYEMRKETNPLDITVLEGSCEASASGTPFYTFLETLRESLNIDDKPALDKVVAGRIRDIDPVLESKIPHMLHLLSIPSDPHDFPGHLDGEELQRELRLALAALFTIMARNKPLLLLIEDWHWCDEASEAALQYLAGLIGEIPIMIVVNHRPDYQPNWGNLAYHTLLPLTALGREESRQVILQTLGVEHLPEQLPRLIHERTGGNPFFMEELCRELVEQGAIEIRGVKEAVTTEAWENMALPETVQAVVRSRLDRLDEATREVVLNASVIGREFGAGLLEVLMPGHQRILAALEKLKALGFVQQVRVVPELEFRFKHVVTQEVAYDIQLLARRRVLHRIIADHLEARQSQGQAQRSEILAMHFLKGEVWPRAVFHSQAAADQAKSHFAHSVALKLSHQALDAAQMGENLENEQVRALVLLGDLHSLLGELEPANSSYEQALAMCGEGAESTGISNRIHRQRSVARDGAKIAYYEHGSGRTTLMFLNPALYGIPTFQPLVERFCQDYHIITLDPRGSGDSDPIPDDYSMRDHMEDIRAVIDDVGATSVVGVGISRGGNPLLMMDTTYPGKLEKIVTIGMPVDDRGPGSLFPKAPDPCMFQAVQERDFETFFRSFIHIFNPEPGLEAYNADLLKVYLQLPEKTILRFLAPDPEMNVVPLFGKIKAPVLLIHGMIDGNVDPKHTNYAAERIHNSQVYEFPNAGHNPWLTAMGEFCEILRQFVETGTVEGAKRGGMLTHV